MKCFRIIDNTDDVQQLQSRDLSNLNDWSANHFMEFNSKKCKYLAITRKKNIVDSAYTLNGSQIMSVLTEKDLGVEFTGSPSQLRVRVKSESESTDRVSVFFLIVGKCRFSTLPFRFEKFES